MARACACLHENETVLIGKDIAVLVAELLGEGRVPHRVRLGFGAPRSIVVVREELTKAGPKAHLPRADDDRRMGPETS
ncbi:MAG: carbon storage regulator [Phycisphaerae bacterium]|nr:carbon storage regulator [Phycisphaerae bacterium]